MGIHLIKMPDIGEGIAEVELVEWHVQPGDSVVEDQVLADVMTDKATVEVPSPVVGKVLWLGGKVGDVMAVGSDLIRIEVQGQGNVADDDVGAAPGAPARAVSSAPDGDAVRHGAAASAGLAATRPGGAADALADAAAGLAGSGKDRASDAAGGDPAAGVFGRFDDRDPSAAFGASNMQGSDTGTASLAALHHGRAPGEKPTASPAVRRRAWDLGIDLRYLAGTGPKGRILDADLQAYAAGTVFTDSGPAASRSVAAGAPGARSDASTEIPVTGLRRRIAQKMQESKRRIPHFSYVEEVDVTELEALRGQLNAQWGAQRGKLTVLPFLARAMVLALREFPHINARFDDDAGVVTQYDAVHLGVAAQTDAGLMVPVLRQAQTLTLWQCAAEIARLAEAARTGKAQRDELSGSTITLTSLGALGGIVSTPVINHPEVAIVGVNRMVEKPVVRDGAIVVRKTMNLSSSFDHRVVDGMHAAQFIQSIRRLLECPALLFVE